MGHPESEAWIGAPSSQSDYIWNSWWSAQHSARWLKNYDGKWWIVMDNDGKWWIVIEYDGCGWRLCNEANIGWLGNRLQASAWQVWENKVYHKKPVLVPGRFFRTCGWVLRMRNRNVAPCFLWSRNTNGPCCCEKRGDLHFSKNTNGILSK